MTRGDEARPSLQWLRAEAHSRSFQLDSLDLTAPADSSRWFLCPTLTPLYYTPVYFELSPRQALRYNQLTGMSFNELIGFFEASFAHPALTAVARSKAPAVSAELRACIDCFLDEEV